MYIFNFPFFISINNIKYFINNYKNLIFFNYKFSFINFLSTYYSVFINLYIKKNLKFVSSFKLII